MSLITFGNDFKLKENIRELILFKYFRRVGETLEISIKIIIKLNTALHYIHIKIIQIILPLTKVRFFLNRAASFLKKCI